MAFCLEPLLRTEFDENDRYDMFLRNLLDGWAFELEMPSKANIYSRNDLLYIGDTLE